MINTLSEGYLPEPDDNELVALAQQGDRLALEQVILRHQNWIFNIALRMVGHPEDAEDVTQEIIIKVLTRLSTFQGRSSFRTWVYRIVTNHVINMKKRGMERLSLSFGRHADIADRLSSMDLPDEKKAAVDARLLIEETKLVCMMGMILCLDRPQRLVFTLGGILGAHSNLGADIMQVTPANFRQRLTRARKQLGNYMNERCGLMDEKNDCRCARKTRALIEAGYVDPNNLRFDPRHVRRVKEIVMEEAHRIDDMLELRAQNLFREHPFYESPEGARMLRNIFEKDEFPEMIDSTWKDNLS